MIILSVVVILLYTALGGHFWRTRWRQGNAVAHPRAERLAIMITMLLHGATLFVGFDHNGVIGIGVGDALSMVLWISVTIFWLGSFYYRLDGIQPLLLLLAGFAVFVALILPAQHTLQNTEMPAFKAHVLVAILANSLLTIAALLALLIGMADRRLRHKHQSLLGNLPPLLDLESMLFKVLGAGFILLTATLVSGIFFSEELFQKPVQFNHKTVFALISWATFAVLLIGRHWLGWRGRVAVRWTLAGFSLLLLAYIGSKFVLEVLLGR